MTEQEHIGTVAMGDTEAKARRSALSDHEAMLDAQGLCVPCKLCGGSAKITDAGTGAGYYIRCENAQTFRPSKGCIISDHRLGGWAYNVMEWWNRLHTDAALSARPAQEPVAQIEFARGVAGRENEMPRVVSCNWLPDGIYSVYAAPQPVLSQPEVKALEWVQFTSRSHDLKAQTIVGDYIVRPSAGDVAPFYCWLPSAHYNEARKTPFREIDAAKAAAQADYEQRIRSALSTPTPKEESK